MKPVIICLYLLLNFCTCRDFYVGMFKRNDFIVAQDNLFKERIPHRLTYAKYGRLFKCPITYVRVVDRLGIGRGPRVQITRGGLGKKYIVLHFTSPYNNPISINIYIACENKIKKTEPIKELLATTVAFTITSAVVEATSEIANATNEPTTITTVVDSPIIKLMLQLQTRQPTSKTKLEEIRTKSEEAATITQDTTTAAEETTSVIEETTTETEEPTTVTEEPTTVTEETTTVTVKTTVPTTESTTMAVKTRKRVLPRDEQENNNL